MRKAFEVENTDSKEKFTMILEPELKEVHTFDTSEDVGKKLQMVYKEVDGNLEPTFCEDFVLGLLKANPSGCKTAEEYYNRLYNKALSTDHNTNIKLLGNVDPDTIQPLDEVR